MGKDIHMRMFITILSWQQKQTNKQKPRSKQMSNDKRRTKRVVKLNFKTADSFIIQPARHTLSP